MAKTPQTVSELFPSKWLKADDLEKSFDLEIAGTEFETVYDARSKEHILKMVVNFKGAQKRLIPNKTQCEALWVITGSEHFADWAGHTVTLSPGRAHNGKPTIIISPPSTQNGQGGDNEPEPPMTEEVVVQGSIDWDS